MSDEKKKSGISDMVIRSPSLIIYTILIGFSIQLGIERILALDFVYWVILNFLVFLITAIRFFHGNYIYEEKPRIEASRRFMLNFYFVILELIILTFVGRTIDDFFIFLTVLAILSITDIIWAIYSYFSNKPEERHNFKVWGILNAIAAGFTISLLLIIIYVTLLEWISIVIFGVYLVLTIADYVLCRDYYFKKTVPEKNE